ncbi:alpha/beta hydrolase family protein [Neobacillus sp. D3-1R]|uniref:alpha/beta hydrolase family protein n=1 Tax=Neobacillus sp. D3-1R TaxID=3445778 RepID=UPI003FA1527D
MEKEIIIQGENPIYGSLTIPSTEGKYPAILIIAGSGPLDRNGNDRKGKYTTNLYKELAEYMGGLGFVTFRYDKRGTGKRDGDWLAAGLSDLMVDAKKAVEFMMSHPNVDAQKVIVCGHSEGTIIATKLTESFELGGLMLLSGGVDNLMEFLKVQRQLAYKELFETPGIKGWLNRKLKVDVKGEKQVENLMKKMNQTDKDIIKIQFFFKQPAKWFREHSVCNTRETLKNVKCPVFALHGDKDPLVDNKVLTELAPLVTGKSEYHIIHNMEHGLRVQTEPRSILNARKIFKELMKRPLHEEGLQKISGWLETNFKNVESTDSKQEVS